MKIILDFDDTIFNTQKSIKELIKVFIDKGFTEQEYLAAYKKSKKETDTFALEIILDFLSKKKSFDKEKTQKGIDLITSKSTDFIYADFFDFVKSFFKCDLYLVSFGATDFQREKIKNSGIVPFLNKIVTINSYKIEEIEKLIKEYQNEMIFFIDDEAVEIDKVKLKFSQVVAIKMERASGRHILPKSELADYTVKNLNEAKKIIYELNI